MKVAINQCRLEKAEIFRLHVNCQLEHHIAVCALPACVFCDAKLSRKFKLVISNSVTHSAVDLIV